MRDVPYCTPERQPPDSRNGPLGDGSILDASIPAVAQLAERGARWVLWRWEERNGRPDKPPLRVNGHYADSTKAATWNTFDECLKAAPEVRADGLGFVLAAERDQAARKPVV